MSAPHLPPLKDIVRKYNLRAKKSLGQNFLFDLNLTSKIARCAEPLDQSHIIEIGSGPGGLTRALLAQGARSVTAIERDDRCIGALEELSTAYPNRLQVVHCDALTFDINTLARSLAIEARVVIVANLPYNIATALLVSWLDIEPWPPAFERMILMFQKEVAERIVATPNRPKSYGRLSILAGWRTDARILFEVPAAAFTPSPKITSSLIELICKVEPASCSRSNLSRVTQVAFGQRRKMLRQALKPLFATKTTEEINDRLTSLGIDPTLRAEVLTLDQFIALANALDQQ